MNAARLVGIAVLLAAGAPIFAQAEEAVAPITQQAPGFYRMPLGTFQVTALLDGTHLFPVDQLLLGARPGEVDRLLAQQYLKAPVEGMINAFLIERGGRLMLVDTGAGELYGPEGGGLVAALQASGHQPADVDDIFLTHLHKDHAGGLLRDGKAVFPNATVHVAKREFDFWTNSRNQGQVGPLQRPFFAAAQRVLAPYRAAGRVQTFEAAGQDLVPGLRALAAPGHTPGHSVYLLHDADQAMLFWGDTVHVAAVQFDAPHVAIQFDWQREQAIAARDALYQQAVANGWWIAAAHISFPGIGHIAEGAPYQYRWVPANYTLNR